MSVVLVLDTETSALPSRGGDYSDVRLIELGYVVLDARTGKSLKEVSLLVDNPGVGDTLENTHVHGITVDELRDHGVPLETALNCLALDMKDAHAVVAHNMKFDYEVLLTEARRVPEGLLLSQLLPSKAQAQPSFVCTMLWGRKMAYGHNKYPKLVELYSSLFPDNTEGAPGRAHRALDDARVCAACFAKMCEWW